MTQEKLQMFQTGNPLSASNLLNRWRIPGLSALAQPKSTDPGIWQPSYSSHRNPSDDAADHFHVATHSGKINSCRLQNVQALHSNPNPPANHHILWARPEASGHSVPQILGPKGVHWLTRGSWSLLWAWPYAVVPEPVSHLGDKPMYSTLRCSSLVNRGKNSGFCSGICDVSEV